MTIKTEWQRQLTYRLDFLGFRLGDLAQVVVQLVIWSAIYKNTPSVSGYTYYEMMTYVVVGWLFLFFNSSYGYEGRISYHIKEGFLSNFLTKPISYLRYITAMSVGRVSITLSMAVIIQLILISLLHRIILPPVDGFHLLISLVMVLLGYFLNLFFSMMIGFIAFWTLEVEGAQYFLSTLKRLFAGAFFPMAILPHNLVVISQYLPFEYAFYAPVQVYLGKWDTRQSLQGLLIEIIWLFILYWLVKVVWHQGLKKYEGVGI